LLIWRCKSCNKRYLKDQKNLLLKRRSLMIVIGLLIRPRFTQSITKKN